MQPSRDRIHLRRFERLNPSSPRPRSRPTRFSLTPDSTLSINRATETSRYLLPTRAPLAILPISLRTLTKAVPQHLLRLRRSALISRRRPMLLLSDVRLFPRQSCELRTFPREPQLPRSTFTKHDLLPRVLLLTPTALPLTLTSTPVHSGWTHRLKFTAAVVRVPTFRLRNNLRRKERVQPRGLQGRCSDGPTDS